MDFMRELCGVELHVLHVRVKKLENILFFLSKKAIDGAIEIMGLIIFSQRGNMTICRTLSLEE